MGTSVTHERTLCRFLNRKGAEPLESVEDFFDELYEKEDMEEKDFGPRILYPLDYLLEESHYLSVTIKKWKYEFRSPAGTNKQWQFLSMTAITE